MSLFRLLKIVVSGPSGVGKTALIRSVTGEPYDPEMQSTIAVDFKVFDLLTDRGTQIKCQIWDTAGQERFHAMTKKYYRGAHVILFVYDVTDMDSFSQMIDFFANAEWKKQQGDTQYHSEIFQHTCAYLVGNKSDLLHDRVVSKENGQALAKEYDLIYAETSALTGDHVFKTFQEAASLMEEYDLQLGDASNSIFSPPKTMTLSLNASNSNQKKCCLLQ